MGSASETARGSHLHPEPVAGLRHMAKKKGFMTPERKKLRTLLRKKAAEELKKEQERKAGERLRVIAERCGTKADLDAASMDDLKKVSKYEIKFAKLQEKAAKFAFANQLKQSKG